MKKGIIISTKILSSTTIEHQIIILEWFLRDHVTMKTGEIMLKIQLWSQE